MIWILALRTLVSKTWIEDLEILKKNFLKFKLVRPLFFLFASLVVL